MYKRILAAVLGRLCSCLGGTRRRWVSQKQKNNLQIVSFFLLRHFCFIVLYFCFIFLLRYFSFLSLYFCFMFMLRYFSFLLLHFCFIFLVRYVEGELLDGRRGLIPSNYVTKLVGCCTISWWWWWWLSCPTLFLVS